MHYISAPVRIRAEQYAAALGLGASEWRAVSDERSIRGATADKNTVHILPGGRLQIPPAVLSKLKVIDHG